VFWSPPKKALEPNKSRDLGIHHPAMRLKIELATKFPVTLSGERDYHTHLHRNWFHVLLSVHSQQRPCISLLFYLNGSQSVAFHFAILLNGWKTRWCTLDLDWREERRQLSDVQMCLGFSGHSLPIRNYLLQLIVFTIPPWYVRQKSYINKCRKSVKSFTNRWCW
jgi:hypothetical protein